MFAPSAQWSGRWALARSRPSSSPSPRCSARAICPVTWCWSCSGAQLLVWAMYYDRALPHRSYEWLCWHPGAHYAKWNCWGCSTSQICRGAPASRSDSSLVRTVSQWSWGSRSSSTTSGKPHSGDLNSPSVACRSWDWTCVIWTFWAPTFSQDAMVSGSNDGLLLIASLWILESRSWHRHRFPDQVRSTPPHCHCCLHRTSQCKLTMGGRVSSTALARPNISLILRRSPCCHMHRRHPTSCLITPFHSIIASIDILLFWFNHR